MLCFQKPCHFEGFILRNELSILSVRCYSAMRFWKDWIGVFLDRIQFDIDLGFFMLKQQPASIHERLMRSRVFWFDIGTSMAFSHLSFLTLGYFVSCFTLLILYLGLVINPALCHIVGFDIIR